MIGSTLRVLVRLCLPGSTAVPACFQRWRAFLRRAREERLAALAAWRLEGRPGVPEPVRDELASIREAVLARNLVRRSWGLRWARALAGAGIRAIPYKGWALTEWHYLRPDVREMADIDILVRRGDADLAVDVLESFGWRRAAGGGGPPAYLNSVNLVPPSEDDGAPFAHLHWHVLNASLPTGRLFPRWRAEDFWERARPADGGWWRMDPAQEIVVLAEHLVKHSLSPLSLLVDLAWAAREADWAAVRGWARQWGAEFAVCAALALLDEFGAAPVSPRAWGGSVRGLDGRAFLAAGRRGIRFPGMSGLAYLSLARGPAGRAGFLSATWFPPREALAAFGKEGGWRAYARRLWRTARMVAGRRPL